MPANVFTTKLLDVIIPCMSEHDLETFDDVFLVLDHTEYDLKYVF